jgi:pimeloyl-ACP methyl ester carboxylesterase
MKRAFITILAVIGLACTASAQNVVGDWQGTLHAGPTDLRLVLHITKADDGSLKATLDSIDQGANGIPVKSVSLKDSKLNMDIEAVHGTYEGTVNSDASEIKGTWTQAQALPLDFKKATTPLKAEHQAGHKPVPPSDIDGAWWGTLDTGVAKLRLVVHITNTEDGLTATLDSPDQGANGIPVAAVTRNGESLKLEAKGIGGVYEGKFDKDLTTIDGTWSQAGRTWPLVLKRLKNEAEIHRRRPQNPVKPYPYREEEVKVENKAAGVTLAGTFTIPQGKGPFPAVFLITGSGPQDRDETLLEHKPFLVLSDYLTRKGIAVLRVDDRGFGQSTGVFGTATSEDFAGDAEAALEYLKTRPEADPHKLGLVGHSEGGMIAPMIAARNHDVAFIVLMAGIGVPGDQLMREQTYLILKAGGASEEEARKKQAKQAEVMDLIRQEKDEAVLKQKIRDKVTGSIPEAQVGAVIQLLGSPWMRYFVNYDPEPTLRKVTCPVLAINGDKDVQVSSKQNLPAIRQALTAAGNKNVEIDEMPGLNHLFQTAKTGAITEYAEIEETMSPAAMEKIAEWILRQ